MWKAAVFLFISYQHFYKKVPSVENFYARNLSTKKTSKNVEICINKPKIHY